MSECGACSIGGGKLNRSGGAAKESHSLRKYCNILLYVEHHNRELYDAIHDLCLTGIFGTHGRQLTFLMPDKKSDMHAAIIKAAYGDSPEEAVKLIKACLLLVFKPNITDFAAGESYPNALRQGLEVVESRSQEVTFRDGARIIPVDNFVPLYTTAEFCVHKMESGMLGTNNGRMDAPAREPRAKMGHSSAADSASVSGGAWAELHSEHKQKQAYVRPSDLASAAINAHLAYVKANCSPAARKWQLGDSINVFCKWGVSLAKYIEEHGTPADKQALRAQVHPNPMCMILFTCLWLDERTYKAWLDAQDPPGLDYSYAAYSKYVASPVEGDNSEACVRECVKYPAEKKDMVDTAKCIQAKYASAFGDQARVKLLYDEGTFLLNIYVRYAQNKCVSDCERIANIILSHFCDPSNQAMLSGCNEAMRDMNSGPLYCKLIEFVLSESFLFPSAFACKTAPLPTFEEPRPELHLNPPKGLNFSARLAEYFS
jgi:hypothetical protein